MTGTSVAQSRAKTLESFLRQEDRERDVISVKRCYLDVCGDLAEGILLSQIVYWFLPSSRTGKSRAVIQKRGKLWLAKRRDDWFEECRIRPKQFDRCVKHLESIGVIETATFKFNGIPMKHIALRSEALVSRIEEVSKMPNEEYGPSSLRNMDLTPTGNMDLPHSGTSYKQRLHTETTRTETTKKDKRLSSNPSDCDGQSSDSSSELTEEQKHREIVRQLLFPLYQERMEKNPKTYTLTPARLDKGLSRFRECLKKCDGDSRAAYDLFAKAINALAASDFHMGRKTKQNSNTKKYNDWIDHLCKSPERFEKWLEASEEEKIED